MISEQSSTKVPHLGVEAVVTFFYYDELEKVSNWYESVIGFRKIYEKSWVVIYEVKSGIRLGLVCGGDGNLKPALEKSAMFSVETADLEGWYAQLALKPASNIVQHIDDAAGGAIRSFFLKDPGGYLLEFFAWKDGEGPSR